MSGERCCRYSKCGKALVRNEGESLKHFEARETCGRSCGALLARERLVASGGAAELADKISAQMREQWAAKNLGWPRVTGEFVGSFHHTNVKTRSFVGKVVPPDRQSYVGCAAARCAE